jgi:WD40 repeat protein
MIRYKRYFSLFLILVLTLSGLLAACGEEAPAATPDYSRILTPADEVKPTATPPFQAAPNITPSPTTEPTPTPNPLATPTLVPNTPILKPTPGTPSEEVVTSDELGVTTWSDTEILWSPKGDIFLLHILRENADGDLYYLVRPPDSVQGGFRLPRSVFASMSWSPDGRYLSYIAKEGDSAAGPVRVIDVQDDPSRERRAFAGPCTAVNWLANGKLVAACGLAVYLLDDELEANARTDAPEIMYKLENSRFEGNDAELSLIFNALPSPDGNLIALFGLRRVRTNNLPVGEIAFFNVANKKASTLDRNNRPITMVDWTPDSKLLVLRNITSDWAVPNTIDFYGADPATLKISQNLTKTNDKCDPVLAAKPDCQGTQPSTMQSNRLVFAPDGKRYFYTTIRYVSRPGVALSSADRLYSRQNTATAKAEQIVETAPGESIKGLTFLPNGRYFYSVATTGETSAKALLDGRAIGVGRNNPAPTTGAGTRTPAPTKSGTGNGAVSGFSLEVSQQLTTTTAAATTAAPATTPPVTTAAPSTTQAPATTQAVTTVAPSPTAGSPAPTSTPLPQGTSLLRFDTATAEARNTPTVAPREPTNTPRATTAASPTPDNRFPRAAAFYMSPMGNWIIAVERIAPTDKAVQFQLRLVPYTLR